MSIRQEIAQLPTDRDALRKFGLLVGFVFCLIGGAFLYFKDAAWAPYVLAAGALLMVLGAIVPAILKPIYIGWMSIAVVLGFFVTRIILTVFFFVVLTPVGLFFRLIGRDALHRKLQPDADSYWIDKEYPIADRSRYENFF